MNKKRVLFVCYGNICRSPAAQGIFQHLLKEHGIDDLFEVDSAGTHDFHVGKQPDSRSIAAAAKRGVDLSVQRARQFQEHDFDRFDEIYVMDQKNKDFLMGQWPAQDHSKITEFIDFADDRTLSHVNDPYYGTEKDFDEMRSLLFRLCDSAISAHQKT